MKQFLRDFRNTFLLLFPFLTYYVLFVVVEKEGRVFDAQAAFLSVLIGAAVGAIFGCILAYLCAFLWGWLNKHKKRYSGKQSTDIDELRQRSP